MFIQGGWIEERGAECSFKKDGLKRGGRVFFYEGWIEEGMECSFKKDGLKRGWSVLSRRMD